MLRQFLLEAALLSGSGGLLGVLLSAAALGEAIRDPAVQYAVTRQLASMRMERMSARWRRDTFRSRRFNWI